MAIVGGRVPEARALADPARGGARPRGGHGRRGRGIDLDGGVGEREYRPASSADLRDRYELGIGELVIDLRDTDLPAGDVPLEVDLGMGQARVLVPDDMCVATDAPRSAWATSRCFGLDNGGVDVDFEDAPMPARDQRG